MPTSLNYASATFAPFRLRYLALGAAAIALGALIDFAYGYTMIFYTSYWVYEISVLANYTATYLLILIGVLLLAAAVPHEGAWINRWKTIACVSLAGERLLCLGVFSAYVLTTEDFGVTPGTAGCQLRTTMECISELLLLALWVCAGIYFNLVAARLGRKPLGVIAACALVPCALYTLRGLTLELMFLVEMTNHPAFKILVDGLPEWFQYYMLWPFFVWGAIALYAGILARHKPLWDTNYNLSTSLYDAPTTHAPVRFWPLAWGAGAIALATTVPLAGVFVRERLEDNAWLAVINEAADLLLRSPMIFAGIILLTAALPGKGGWAGCWKTITGISLAGVYLLASAVSWALLTSDDYLYRGMMDTPNQAALDILMVLRLALLVSAGMYLANVGAHLGAKRWGLIAAATLAPSVLHTLLDLATRVADLIEKGPGLGRSETFTIFSSTCLWLDLRWLPLVWASIALCAAILALQKPR